MKQLIVQSILSIIIMVYWALLIWVLKPSVQNGRCTIIKIFEKMKKQIFSTLFISNARKAGLEHWKSIYSVDFHLKDITAIVATDTVTKFCGKQLPSYIIQ